MSATLLALWTAAALSAVPPGVAYRGVLLSPAGDPANGTFEITVSLIDSEDAQIWQEAHEVNVKGGLYTITLGGQSALPVDVFATHAELSLSVQVEADPPLPDVPLSAVLSVHEAATAATAGGLDCSGCVTAVQLAEGAVGSAALAEGAVAVEAVATGAVTADAIEDAAVTSLHIEDGAVTLAHLAPLGCAGGSIVRAAGDGWFCGPLTLQDTGTVLAGYDQMAGNDLTFASQFGGAVKGTWVTLALTQGAVGPKTLAAGAVGTEALGDKSVTNDKLEPDVFALDKLAFEAAGFGLGETAAQALDTLQTGELSGLLALFPTGWSTSAPGGFTGPLRPASVWRPIARRTRLLKRSATSALKVTLSDDLEQAIGCQSGTTRVSVRIDGHETTPDCGATTHNWVDDGAYVLFSVPYANVCILEGIDRGLHELEVWVGAGDCTDGYSQMGLSNTTAQYAQTTLLVEEIEPASYAHSTEGTYTHIDNEPAWAKADGREVTFQKSAADSVVKLTYADTVVASYKCNDGTAFVQVRMDGNPLVADCYTTKRSGVAGTGGTNTQDPVVMTCVVPLSDTDEHTYSVWRKNTGCGLGLGWGRHPLLLVEEVPKSEISYTLAPSAVGPLGPCEGGCLVTAAGRSVEHTVSPSATGLKLTYSDTFESSTGCNGGIGFASIYMDGEPLKHPCLARMGFVTSTGTHDHRFPLNLTCTVPAPTPELHTFTVKWGASGCGSVTLGAERGQRLLMVEELK